MEGVSTYFEFLLFSRFTGRPMNCVWMKHSGGWISKSLFTPKWRKLHILYHNVQIRVLTSKAQTWCAVIWNRLFKQDMQWKNTERHKKPPGKNGSQYLSLFILSYCQNYYTLKMHIRQTNQRISFLCYISMRLVFSISISIYETIFPCIIFTSQIAVCGHSCQVNLQHIYYTTCHADKE